MYNCSTVLVIKHCCTTMDVIVVNNIDGRATEVNPGHLFNSLPPPPQHF